MAQVKSILLVGVGGQGTILVSKILTAGLLKAGYDVKMSEIHGMAQRGGSVSTTIRYGEKVYSPVIGLGEADVLISFEKMEAVRWSPYLKPEGIAVINDYEIAPLPVAIGKAEYPQNTIESMQACFDTRVLPGAELAASDSPPVAAMSTFTNIGALVIAIGGICACISTSNGLMMSGSRIPFAMGRAGDLPKGLASINKHGAPAGALILTLAGQLALCLSGSAINTLVALSVCATIVSWVITTVCAIVTRVRGVKAPFRAPGYPITPIIELFRAAFLGAADYSLKYNALSMGVTLLVAALGVVLFSHTDKTFMDTV